MIREPIIVVGGHVDHGKTTLLDYLRGTTVAEREAGRITQHIGATEVPLSLIQKKAGDLLKKYNFNLRIPGLLFIDTPGHEAFSTLRERGCDVADMGVLVIDILQGVQPQTVEVINFLKKNKTPFIVAITKIDKIKGYTPSADLKLILKEVDEGKSLYATEFQRNLYSIMARLSEYGFDSERFDLVEDFTKKLLLIPVNSKTGCGVPELILFLAGLSQKYLEGSLTISESNFGKAVVLEVNETKGFGKTCDIILCDGVISKNDFVRVDSKDSFYVSKVRMLLKPKPLYDIHSSKDAFETVDMVSAASGLKVVFVDNESVCAGDMLTVISEVEAKSITATKKQVTTIRDKGVVVRCDTEGSAEAITVLAKKEGINIGRIAVGNVTKEDCLEAKLFARENPVFGAILVFNQKISSDIEEFSKSQGIQLFSSNVIYDLVGAYSKWQKAESERVKAEELKEINYPCKFEVIPQCIFRVSKPFIAGVKVLDGILKPGVKIFYNGKVIGKVKDIQDNGKSMKEARQGQEVAVSFDDISFEKDIDLNVSNLFYTYIPSQEREIVKKHLFSEFPVLIDELFSAYISNGL